MVDEGDILNGKHTLETTIKNLKKEKYLNCPLHIEESRKKLESSGNDFIHELKELHMLKFRRNARRSGNEQQTIK